MKKYLLLLIASLLFVGCSNKMIMNPKPDSYFLSETGFPIKRIDKLPDLDQTTVYNQVNLDNVFPIQLRREIQRSNYICFRRQVSRVEFRLYFIIQKGNKFVYLETSQIQT